MSETTAAPGPAAPRGRGAPPASERDPDSMCTAMKTDGSGRCTRFKVSGSTVCQVHGAHKAPRARHAIVTVAEKNGIVLPEVKPSDFPRIAAEVIAWNLQQFAELGAELEKLRLLHSPIHHAREYGDIFNLLDQMGRTIATLTKAAAALPPIPEKAPVAPAAAKIMEALEGIRERMGMSTGSACTACGCRGGCGGVAPEGSEDGSDGPGAAVLPYNHSTASDGAQVVTPEGELL